MPANKMIPVSPENFERVNQVKHAYGWTYDEMIGQMLTFYGSPSSDNFNLRDLK